MKPYSEDIYSMFLKLLSDLLQLYQIQPVILVTFYILSLPLLKAQPTISF